MRQVVVVDADLVTPIGQAAAPSVALLAVPNFSLGSDLAGPPEVGPLPRKRTSQRSRSQSALGHVQTHAPHQTAPFNHCTQVGPSPAQPLLRFGFLGRRADPGQRREVPHSGMVEHM